jgi:hypothetical protein
VFDGCEVISVAGQPQIATGTHEYALATWMTHELGPHSRVLAYSRGTFAAAVAAAVLHPEQALSLIVQQALCLEKCCESGGIIAVLHEVNCLGVTPSSSSAPSKCLRTKAHGATSTLAPQAPSPPSLYVLPATSRSEYASTFSSLVSNRMAAPSHR